MKQPPATEEWQLPHMAVKRKLVSGSGMSKLHIENHGENTENDREIRHCAWENQDKRSQPVTSSTTIRTSYIKHRRNSIPTTQPSGFGVYLRIRHSAYATAYANLDIPILLIDGNVLQPVVRIKHHSQGA